MKEDKDYTIESVQRAGELLKYIAEQKNPVTASEAGRAVGMNNNAAFRTCWTLHEKLGFLEKIGDRYILGSRLSMIWAKRKAIVENIIQQATSELQELETRD